MASRVKLKKEYIKVDLNDNNNGDQCLFFRVELLSLGYNDLQVVFTEGKVGNKGRSVMYPYKDFKHAQSFAYTRIFDMEAKGYIQREDLQAWLGQLPDKKRLERKEMHRKHNASMKCDDCGSDIPKATHSQIVKWARGPGNWDKEKSAETYRKVFCIACQEERGIFKKRL